MHLQAEHEGAGQNVLQGLPSANEKERSVDHQYRHLIRAAKSNNIGGQAPGTTAYCAPCLGSLGQAQAGLRRHADPGGLQDLDDLLRSACSDEAGSLQAVMRTGDSGQLCK